MISRGKLFGLLLAIPLFGFAVAEGVQAHLNSTLQSAVRTRFPLASEQQVRAITLDRLCEDPSPALAEICRTNSNLTLVRRAALGVGAAGLAIVLLVRLAGAVAKDNRNLLVAVFRPGLYLIALILSGLVLAHAAVAIAAIYFGESALVGRIHVGIIAAIGVGALAGVVAMARSTFSLVKKAQTIVVGKALDRRDAPELWRRIDETARRLGALKPDNLVIGLDPQFFVTEADVICLSGTLNGRTLYCSLPLCRILNSEELTAILGHELGHFKGEDTKFSKRFYPIYSGTAKSLAALQNPGCEGLATLAILPAVAVLSYFFECFSLAERSLSRGRELAADHAAASVTSSRTIATALVKLHAFTGAWRGLQDAATNALRNGKAFVNASRAYAEAVRRNAAPIALEGIAEERLSHPTDSHPPLSVRLEALALRLNDVAADALAVTPAGPAIREVSDAETHEEEISAAYQMLLAQRLGISLAAATAVKGGA